MWSSWSRPTNGTLTLLTFGVGVLVACHGMDGRVGPPVGSDSGGGAGENPGFGGTNGATGGRAALTDQEVRARLEALSPKELPGPVPDPTNRYADDPAAAALGQKFFFDTRFSGPLLDSDNNGLPGTLGMKGDTGRVSCASCHNPRTVFDDRRSPKAQISLGAGWTRRRSPSLLDVGQATLLMWDGRRDTGYSQIFGVIQNPLEFNSSLTFVAQQIERYYRAEYERVFGPMPELAQLSPIAPEDAGCLALETGPTPAPCLKQLDEDARVTRVIVNVGKALSAYQRLLACGPSRFDQWVHGDETALSADEQAGAELFVRVGCDSCHSGPYLSDQKFHNVGAANRSVNIIEPFDDPGAGLALQAALADPVNSKSEYSDGDDGRLDEFLKMDPEEYRGAFRTPTLRCVGRRPSFLHAGQARTLEDVVYFFNKGGDQRGYQGQKSSKMVPLALESNQIKQLVAFLRALEGVGPTEELRAAPALPE